MREDRRPHRDRRVVADLNAFSEIEDDERPDVDVPAHREVSIVTLGVVNHERAVHDTAVADRGAEVGKQLLAARCGQQAAVDDGDPPDPEADAQPDASKSGKGPHRANPSLLVKFPS